MADATLIKSTEAVGYYHPVRNNSMLPLHKHRKMHGVKRVIIFCLLIVILPATLIIIPLYLRHHVFSDVVYPVAESDIIEIRDGISSIFCQQHSLKMDTNFNAFQLRSKPEISTNLKHIRLKKSMTLPDDTLEYWGFYLLKGAIVKLKVCSRYDGSRILVVKGARNLETCGLLEHNKNKVGAHFAQGHEKVQVTFETVAEVVISEENNHDDDDQHLGRNMINKEKEEEWENHAKEDLGDEDSELFTNDTIMEEISSHKQLLTPLAPREFLTAQSDNKTELISSNSLGKTHETDTQKNAINANTNNGEKKEHQKIRHRRHYAKDTKNGKIKRSRTYIRKKQKIYNDLYGSKRRRKRDQVYDRKISHGGNAFNFTNNDSDSISSFENSLLICYDGQILLAQGFPPSSLCSSVRYLENSNHLVSRHEVVEDGYYYYIFYSDNDLVSNDIHAVFDIYKPTFQYANITDSKACVNSSNCTFPINFLSDEIVIVEVPTRDGIEHDEDDITYLTSTCHPRMSVYVIFPIAVLFLILSCAFL